MKYAIVIPDGASDEPQDSLGGKTPLQAAHLPEMDRLAKDGVLGRSNNVPAQFLPGSDVATLSLFGYDPRVVFTGRAPLEVAAMGVNLGPGDWAIRCNLMTILDGQMTDFTAGHITSEEGAHLIEALQQSLGGGPLEFVPGVSYRNALIHRAPAPFAKDTRTTPPHDVPDRAAADYLPQGPGSDLLRDLMARGSEIVARHPVNEARAAAGRRPATRSGSGGRVALPA